MYREEQTGSSFMLGMLTGAFVGAGLALLFAPRSGQEIRQQLGQQYRGIADRVGEQAHTLKDNASHWREQGRERLQNLTGQLSDRASSSPERQATTLTPEAGFPSSSAPSV